MRVTLRAEIQSTALKHHTTSVVIPAFNEESYLPATLQAVTRSAALAQARYGIRTEIIVVDNSSTDATAEVARSYGARVVAVPEHNVARVRNCGAAAATGQDLVFLDADTWMPEELLSCIHEAINIHGCIGGAVDTEYRAQKRTIRPYLFLWRVVGKLARIAQGATQFCRQDLFASLGGYDESLFMGEDVDFYRRLRKYARRAQCQTCLISDLRVRPSTRRFDRWPFWRTLLWTNPMVAVAFRRVRSVWRSWYESPLR